MLDNNTSLQIGPLKYTHVVQKVAVQERKAVDVLSTARSNRNFVVDSGESLHHAQIRFIFTGLDEINGGLGEDSTPSGLRGLIALFKCCPIVSVRNDYLSTSWKRQASLIKDDDVLTRKTTSYTPLIPVALHSLDLENIPDIPYSIQATLSLSRVDIGPVSESDIFEYLGVVNRADNREDPRDAYWLKKWINQVLSGDLIPELTAEDFDKVEFNWYGETSIGTKIESNKEQFHLHLTTSDVDNSGIVVSENCSIQHKFAFNKLISDSYSFPSHMGTSARSLSLDIVFNNQTDLKTYESFCRFKDTSDNIIRSRERYDRVAGWHVKTPISKLLAIKKNIQNTLPGERPWEGVYVPINVSSENGSEPNMINCRVDMVENNIDFYKDNEIVLTNGGTDYNDLKKYFDRILDEELKFRIKLNYDKEEALKEIIGRSDADSYKSFQLFWPIEKGIINLKPSKTFSILNIDTLRAVFLDNKFDQGGDYVSLEPVGAVRAALQDHPLSSGEVIVSRRVTIADKVIQNGTILWQLLSGLNLEDPATARVIQAIKSQVKNSFLSFGNDIDGDSEALETISTEIALQLTQGYLGDTASVFSAEGTTAKVIQRLFSSDFKFLDAFKEALFRVIIERKPKPRRLPEAYSTDGIYSAFYKLIVGFTLEKDSSMSLEESRKEYEATNRNLQAYSLYPDLLLPTYFELYGDRWQEFAPTIGDLGIETYGGFETENRDSIPAVQAEDIVSPAAWLFIRRSKTVEGGLKTRTAQIAKEIDKISSDMSISVPFNTNEIDDIRDLMKNQNPEDNGTRGLRTNKSLPEIIQSRFLKYRETNEAEYREDITNILSSPEKYEKGFLGGEGSLKLYLHHNGNHAVPRQVNIPGAGAIIYRVVANSKQLTQDSGRRLDEDENLTTTLDPSIKFNRHGKDNTKKLMDSCLDQIADDHYSPERMFPSIKVYLIDKRGDDVIADDGLFSLNALISVDVTLDKNDAPLAVIKVADPLYTLQGDYFDKRNIAYKDHDGDALPDKEGTRILASLRGPDKDSTIKRYKLAQGRSIQIRMGYSSMAYNLPIIFTGKITEIVPGDQLTIVAQGWKAELINRKVSFYNEEPKNWGAKDLAVQAITYANPEGFGEYYPEHDAQFILRNLRSDGVANAIQQSIDNGMNVDLEGVGTRGIPGGISNYIIKILGFRSTDKKDTGFDTRLKNIWYPDTSLYNNVLGLRSRFGMMPSYINDSWIIPLQPAWNALQEASRHAWNCVIDVVPYDNEATIFMGHPDQPYFYTRGTRLSKSLYNKYRKTKVIEIEKTLADLMVGFLDSKYYWDEEVKLESVAFATNAVADQLTGLDGVRAADRIDFIIANSNVSYTNIKGLKAFIKVVNKTQSGVLNAIFGGIDNFIEYFTGDRSRTLDERVVYELSRSGLPAAQLGAVKDLGFYSDPATYMFSKFFGISFENIRLKWPTIERDIEEILARNSRYKELKEDVKTQIKGVSGLSYYDESLINYLEEEANRDATYERFAKQNLRGTASPLVFLPKFQEQTKELRNSSLDISIYSYIEFYKRNQNLAFLEIRTSDSDIKRAEKLRKEMVVDLLNQLKSIRDKDNRKQGSVLKDLGIDVNNKDLSTLIEENINLFKAFVYYFSTYILEDPQANRIVSEFSDPFNKLLPPNMKVFRVHHFADDDHNIVQNNIVASTREMWNTVVVERPAQGSAESTVPDEGQLYTEGRLSAGTNWEYYPKQEVTGVIGLQFHPGLTLANKKVKVFTELNCQSDELSAKLVCGHLAQGIRKMYRGNLLLLGKHIKPYDRIILADKYTRMTGPVEVESVIHHWNVEQGWLTNIIPNAVCDANPGAAILHTAAMESAYQSVYNTLEFVSDALMVATVIATLGAATPLAAGHFGIKRGLVGIAKNFLGKGGGLRAGTKTTLKAYAAGGKKLLSDSKKLGSGVLTKGKTWETLKQVFKDYSGPGIAILKNEVTIGSAQYATHLWARSNVISSFIESNKDVEQLPVILSPLIYNGNPFTAALETEDAIWAMSAFGFFHSFKQMQQGAALLYGELFE